jgi:hypothetical protein
MSDEEYYTDNSDVEFDDINAINYGDDNDNDKPEDEHEDDEDNINDTAIDDTLEQNVNVLSGDINRLLREVNHIKDHYGISIDMQELCNFEKSDKVEIHKIIDDENRTTSDVLSKMEFAGILAIRATHLEKNAPSIEIHKYVMSSEENKYSIPSSPIKLALQELKNRTLPLLVKRKVYDSDIIKLYELWNPNEMTIDPKFFSMVLS